MLDINENDLHLISRYLDKTLAAEEISELEDKLSANTAFADQFARCALTHRQIIELLTEEKLHTLLDQAIGISPPLPREMKLEQSTRAKKISFSQNLPDAGHSGRLFSRMVVGIAAALLITVGVFLRSKPITDGSRQIAANSKIDQARDAVPELDAESSVAATVTRISGYQSVAGSDPLQIGDQLETGARLAFETGIVKLTFGCGAEVTLQGPCDFLLETSMLGYLKKGSVTANVPRRAFSFGIRAPGIDFIDLGTDFGISVDPEGKSELHVFEGEVIYRQDLETLKSTDVVYVKEDEAVQFNSLSDKPSQIAMDRKRFSQHFDLRSGYTKDSELPISRELALWLSAHQGVITDEDSNVLSWYDLTLGDNRSAEDAFQSESTARPKLVAEAINGMPGVRFDGENDHLFTTSLETTDNQTVVLVCQFSKSAFSRRRVYGGQILNYDGPPTRELTSTLAPGVLQIGEPLLKEEFQPSFISAQVFAGFIGSTTVEAGRVDARPVGANTPVIITYRYDFEHGTAKLMLNGHVYDEARAFAPAGLTSRKVIGRHAWMELFFHGDLSELLIYNCALAAGEIEQVTQHLAEKYKIPLERPEIGETL